MRLPRPTAALLLCVRAACPLLDSAARRTARCAAFGTSEQRLLQAIYIAMDDGNRGWVSFSQFATALSTFYRGDKDDVLSFWFRMYDRDRDGLLDRQVRRLFGCAHAPSFAQRAC